MAILSFFIGTKIKQAIRKSNVERMNQELPLVEGYIDDRKIGGAPKTVNGQPSDSFTKTQREGHLWYRAWFEEGGRVKKKAGIRRAFTRSTKSGILTMGERRDELKAYLEKYDKKAARDTVWAGFKWALTTDEGNTETDNPAFEPKFKAKVDAGKATPKTYDFRHQDKVTLRQ